MKSTLKAVLIGTLLTTSFGLAAAPNSGCQDGWKARAQQGRTMDQSRRWDRIADRLNITDEQRTTMRGIREEARPQMRTLRDKMKANRKQLRESARDPARVAELAQVQGTLQAEMIVLRSGVRSKIDAVLTDHQREQMKTMRAAGRKRR